MPSIRSNWSSDELIPNNVIATVGKLFSHTRINTLFMESSFPGDAPMGNCIDKSQSWIRAANTDRDRRPLEALADLLGNLQIRMPDDVEDHAQDWQRIHASLAKAGLSYDGLQIGRATGHSATTPSSEVARDVALRAVTARPSAAPLAQRSSTTLNVAGNDNSSREVFIAHGHDNALKNTIARFVAALGLIPIILHEQADHGETIIAKLEAQRSTGFAIVLCTGDDVGCAATRAVDAGNWQRRARQNVVLELGFFLGCLGRPRVCAVVADGVEIPSDIDGVLFAPIAEWQQKLFDRLSDCGYSFQQDQIRSAMAIR